MIEKQEEVKRISEQVLSYTREILGLTNSSYPVLESPGDFSRSIRLYEEGVDVGVERSFLAEDDLAIHLNYRVLEGGLFREMVGSILAYFQAPGFVLESTEHGQEISEERRRCLETGTTSNPELGRLLNNGSYLSGVAKYVEVLTDRFLQREYGYDFDTIKDEVMREFGPETSIGYRGFEIARDLHERARELPDLEGFWDEIIAASLLLAGKSDNFDRKYEELSSFDIPRIFSESGYLVIGIPADLQVVERHIGEVFVGLGELNQWKRVKGDWGSLYKELIRSGAPRDLLQACSSLYAVFDGTLRDEDNINMIGEGRLSELRTLLNSIRTDFVDEWGERRVRYYRSR